MDLAGMINNGVEALHRGSVDKSGDGAQQASSHDESSSPTSKDAPESGSSERSSARPARNGRGNKASPPQWARVYRGRRNKVRDVRRWKLAETRPELGEMFAHGGDSDESGQTEPGDAVSEDGEHADDGQKHEILPPSPFTNPRGTAASAADIGPGGNASLTGLTASLAGLIPNDDQTQVLAGWLFERIEKIEDPSILDHLEVEFKMGYISDEHSGARHRFPTMSEAVVDSAYYQQHRLRFKSEIDISRFKALESLLDSLAAASLTNDANNIVRENVLTRDAVYQLVYEPLGTGKSRIRVSFDDKERVIDCISKKRIGDIFISLPNAAYDLKMSLSIEYPVDADTIMPEIKTMQAGFERNKNRLKWKSPGCVVDLTSVHGQSVNGAPSVTKEAEIEINSEIFSSVLHEYRDSRDKSTSLDKFLEVVRYTMDSARFLVRNI